MPRDEDQNEETDAPALSWLVLFEHTADHLTTLATTLSQQTEILREHHSGCHDRHDHTHNLISAMNQNIAATHRDIAVISAFVKQHAEILDRARVEARDRNGTGQIHIVQDFEKPEVEDDRDGPSISVRRGRLHFDLSLSGTWSAVKRWKWLWASILSSAGTWLATHSEVLQKLFGP